MRTTKMMSAPFPRVSAGGVAPASLNAVYSYGQFWIPAGAITPSTSLPCVIETYENSGGAPATQTVAKYAPSVAREGFWNWGFKADFVNVSAITLKLAPLWFAKTTASNPNAGVKFEGYAGCANIGTSVNTSPTGSTDMTRDVPATAYQIAGGKTGDEQASIEVVVSGDTISASGWNLLTLNMERHGNEAGDTFADDVYLLGVGVQFAVDFNNVAEWPT